MGWDIMSQPSPIPPLGGFGDGFSHCRHPAQCAGPDGPNEWIMTEISQGVPDPSSGFTIHAEGSYEPFGGGLPLDRQKNNRLKP